MRYWRMQLHPGDPNRAMKWAVESLAKGFIGFGYEKEPGDLTLIDAATLDPDNPYRLKKDELDFATGMAVGDKVLVLVHQYPFALLTIDSDYYYLRDPDEEVNVLGIWFNHFRRVRDIKHYADWVKNPHNWDTQFHLCPTIQILIDPEAESYKLIESWP